MDKYGKHFKRLSPDEYDDLLDFIALESHVADENKKAMDAAEQKAK